MKKILAIVVATILMITVFAACTKDKTDNDSPSDDPGISAGTSLEPSPSEDAEEVGEPVEREYSIPEDAIDISGLFEEESPATEESSDTASDMGGDAQHGKKAANDGRS